jgi:hypothetical protein
MACTLMLVVADLFGKRNKARASCAHSIRWCGFSK